MTGEKYAYQPEDYGGNTGTTGSGLTVAKVQMAWEAIDSHATRYRTVSDVVRLAWGDGLPSGAYDSWRRGLEA